MGQKDGVIATGAEPRKHLHRFFRIAGGAQHDFFKEFLIDVIGTGKGGQQAALPQVPERLQIDVLVAPGCPHHILSGLGKGRRVQDDQIKGIVRFPEILKNVRLNNGVLFR